MNETIDPTAVEHDMLALWVILSAMALLTVLSSASGGFTTIATRLVVAASSGA